MNKFKNQPPLFSTGFVNISALLKSGNFHLDHQGYLIAKNGSRYRLPSGPPEGRPKRIDSLTTHLSDSSVTSDVAFEFNGKRFNIKQDVVTLNKSQSLPETVKKTPHNALSKESVAFPIILNSVAFLINLALIILAVYLSWMRRKRITSKRFNLPPKPLAGHLKFEQFAQRNNVKMNTSSLLKRESDIQLLRSSNYTVKPRAVSGRRKVDFDTLQFQESSSVSGTSWAYGSEPDERYIPNGSETTDSILKTDSNCERSLDQTKSSDFTRENESPDTQKYKLLLITIAIHLATLGVFLSSMQLFTIYTFRFYTTRELEHGSQAVCILTNPLATDTIFAARLYLVAMFFTLIYVKQYGFACFRRQVPLDEAQFANRKLTIQQKWAYLSLTHSLPWALAAGSALIIALLPLFYDDHKNRNSFQLNFFMYEFNVLDMCTKMGSKLDNVVLIVVLLVLLPTSSEVIICIIHLLSDSKNKCLKLSIFLFFITCCLSPGLTAVSKLCAKPSGFLLKKLPFFHLAIDPCLCGYLLKANDQDMDRSIDQSEAYQYEPPTSPIPEEPFAEYPPDNAGSKLNICMPIGNVNMMLPSSHSHSREFGGLLSACISPNNVNNEITTIKPPIQSVYSSNVIVSNNSREPIFTVADSRITPLFLAHSNSTVKANPISSSGNIMTNSQVSSQTGTLKRSQLCERHKNLIPTELIQTSENTFTPIQPLEYQSATASSSANGTLAMKAVIAATAAVVAAQKAASTANEQEQYIASNIDHHNAIYALSAESNSGSCMDSSSSCACQKVDNERNLNAN